jgi:PAS domain S-box-containing protein
MGDAVVTVDYSGKVTMLNPAAEVLTGWTQSDAIGRPIDEVMILLDAVTHRPVVNPALEAIQTGQTANLGHQSNLLMGRQGKEIPISDNAALIHDAQGMPSGVVAVFRQITASSSNHR